MGSKATPRRVRTVQVEKICEGISFNCAIRWWMLDSTLLCILKIFPPPHFLVFIVGFITYDSAGVLCISHDLRFLYWQFLELPAYILPRRLSVTTWVYDTMVRSLQTSVSVWIVQLFCTYSDCSYLQWDKCSPLLSPLMLRDTKKRIVAVFDFFYDNYYLELYLVNILLQNGVQ